MRYTLALVALLSGCSPAAAPSDAGPPLPAGWSACPPECAPVCGAGGTAFCGEAPACIACESFCALPMADGGYPEQVACDTSDFWCGGRIVTGALPLGGQCFRSGF